jgi:hypothetical protein
MDAAKIIKKSKTSTIFLNYSAYYPKNGYICTEIYKNTTHEQANDNGSTANVLPCARGAEHRF